MLEWNRITDPVKYDSEVSDLLVLLEGSTKTPYVDSVGVPTIGIGYNLRVNLEPVLRAMVGARHYDANLLNRLDAEVDKTYGAGANAALASNLDRVMAKWHDNHDSRVPSSFSFSGIGQIKTALNAISPNYDEAIDDWLSGIPESAERAALFSLTWNAPSLLGPKLKAAIESGDRAEAWYEIRYNSNGSAISGLANRRYVEANQFSLYDHANSASFKEAVTIGRMVANHHEKILSYEFAYDPDKAGQIKGIAEIDPIGTECGLAITRILDKFGIDPLARPEELLAAGPKLEDLAGDGTSLDSRSNDADLLVGDNNANLLDGGRGKDILIGRGGKDILTGGGGADLFIFFNVSDSARGGKNQDVIEDFQTGRDLIDLSHIDANGAARGNAFQFLSGMGDGFTNHAGELRFFQNASRTIIEGDIDGDGRADLRIVLDGHKALTDGDFLL